MFHAKFLIRLTYIVCSQRMKYKLQKVTLHTQYAYTSECFLLLNKNLMKK